MNKYYCFAIFILLLAGCAKNKIHKAVEIYFSSPLILKSGEVFEMKQEFSIYSFKDVLVYELPFFLKKETDSISTNVKKIFIFNREAENGVMYFPALPQSPKVFKVDSVLKAETLIDFGDILTLDEKVFVSKIIFGDTIKEIYMPKIKKDYTYPDTVVIAYLTTKIDLDYSLSKKIEKVKNRTVVEVNSIFNPTIVEGVSFPKRNFIFKMKIIDKIPSEQLKKVQKYLKKFEQDSQQLIKEKG